MQPNLHTHWKPHQFVSVSTFNLCKRCFVTEMCNLNAGSLNYDSLISFGFVSLRILRRINEFLKLYWSLLARN